jgi:hypothetical protein
MSHLGHQRRFAAVGFTSVIPPISDIEQVNCDGRKVPLAAMPRAPQTGETRPLRIPDLESIFPACTYKIPCSESYTIRQEAPVATAYLGKRLPLEAKIG